MVKSNKKRYLMFGERFCIKKPSTWSIKGKKPLISREPYTKIL